MTKFGRKRLEKMNEAICKLVDARIGGHQIHYSASSTFRTSRIYVRNKREPWRTIADWRSAKDIKPHEITYEEADALIRKHIGFGIGSGQNGHS